MNEYSTGFFIGLLTVWIIVFIKMVYESKKNGVKNDDYDERQQLVRYRGYKYGFFVIVIFLVCVCLIEGITNRHFIDTDAVTIIGICVSVGVHVTYCIWNEGYFPVKNNRKAFIIFIIMALATVTLSIFFSIEAVKEGNIVVDGVITGYCGNIACAFLFTFICIVALTKFAIEKKEDEQ